MNGRRQQFVHGRTDAHANLDTHGCAYGYTHGYPYGYPSPLVPGADPTEARDVPFMRVPLLGYVPRLLSGLVCAFIAIPALLCAFGIAMAQPPVTASAAPPVNEWPSVRGPNWDGHSAETGIADRWPSEGPPVLWTRELGAGYSSFAMWEAHAATMYQDASRQYVICLDLATGRTRWRHRCDWPYEHGGRYPGPRATPTYAHGKLYFASAFGRVGCLDAQTGRALWSVHLRDDLQAEITGFGYSCSPTVCDGLVILPAGGKQSALIALDADTGAVRWRSGDEEASYCPALPIRFRGRSYVVACLQNHLVCHDIDGGARVWSHRLSAGYDEHSCWPLYREPQLWISGPFNKGGQLLELTGDPRAPIRVARQDDPLPNDIFSSVLANDAIFGFDVLEPQSNADRSTRGLFRCLDWETGRELWSAGSKRPLRATEFPTTTGGDWPGHAQVLAVDGKLLLLNDLGELMLLRSSRERCEILARATVLGGELCWSAPALAKGIVLVRNASRVVCLDLKRPADRVAADRSSAAVRSQAAGRSPRLTVADIPRQPLRDQGWRWLGFPARPQLEPPTAATLQRWFWQCLVVAVGGLALAPLARLGGQRLGWTIWRPGSDLAAGKRFAAAVAIATPSVTAAWLHEPWFTWPLALFLAFELLVAPSLANWAAVHHASTTRLPSWKNRLGLLSFLALALGWIAICHRSGLVFETAFAGGVSGAALVAFLSLLLRPPPSRHGLVHTVGLIVGFIAFYGPVALLLRAIDR